MMYIPLTKGKFVKIDEDDYEKIKPYSWFFFTERGYAVTKINDKRVHMHRIVLGEPPKGLVTDHINRNKLDNTKRNLRFITNEENLKNRGFHQVLGVTCSKGYWQASIQIAGKRLYKNCPSLEAAINQRLAWEKQYLKYGIQKQTYSGRPHGSTEIF